LVIERSQQAGADADEHLDELRAGNREEGHSRLAGDGLGQQGLAGSRRADQQHTLGNTCSEADELLRLLQEFDDLLQFLLGLLHPGDILEGHRRLVAGEHAGPALAEGHRLIVGALRLPQHEEDQPDDDQSRQQVGDQAQDGVPITRLFDLPNDRRRDQLLGGHSQSQQLFDCRGRRLFAREATVAVGEDDLQLVLVDDDPLDLTTLDGFGQLIEVVRLGLGLGGPELDHQGRYDEQKDQQDGRIPSTRRIHHNLLGFSRLADHRRATEELYPTDSNICLRVM
jgi:hypothetical protein